MLPIVDLLTFCASAINRQLQCVMPLGLLCSVASTMAWIFSDPAGRARGHLPQHPQTIRLKSFSPKHHGLAIGFEPVGHFSDRSAPAAAGAMLHRSATCCGVPKADNHRCSCFSSDSSRDPQKREWSKDAGSRQTSFSPNRSRILRIRCCRPF